MVSEEVSRMSLKSITTLPAVIRVFLCSSGPAIAFIALSLSLGGLFVIGASGDTFLLLAIAMISRSLGEWFGHKYILHSTRVRLLGVCIRNPVGEMHARHHATPDDIDGVHFGPMSVTGILILAYAVGSLWGVEFSLGFIFLCSACLLLYEWAHLVSHTAYVPKSRYFRKIVARHRYHHYEDPKRCFTVSQPWADVLFKTDLPHQYIVRR